jgi:hypothetical protein
MVQLTDNQFQQRILRMQQVSLRLAALACLGRHFLPPRDGRTRQEDQIDRDRG